MKSKLLILTARWPYGKIETFLENEAPYVSGFDTVCCMPYQAEGTARAYPEKIGLLAPQKKLGRWRALLAFVFSRCFRREFAELLRRRRLSLARIKILLRDGVFVQNRYRMLKKYLAQTASDDTSLTVYSYWMASDAAAAARLKQQGCRFRLITRCHRFDLYEERSSAFYLPFRSLIFQYTDDIFPIADDGASYLLARYSMLAREKVEVFRLGTIDHGPAPVPNGAEPLRIVSCSNLIPVKRVHLMLDALQETKIPIVWSHFGDGPELEKLKKQAGMLPSHILFRFEGRVDNSALMEWYGEHPVDLFVNTSESEGVPVSIMEAMSFGIPVIATDVGGNSEIVLEDQTGKLLEKEFAPRMLAALIERYAELPHASRSEIRRRVRSFWMSHYSAEKNYANFYRYISASPRQEEQGSDID